MIGNLVRSFGDRFFSPVNTRCARSGMTKTHINVLALVTGCASGVSYALAWIPAGWALLLIHGFLDYLDGGTRRTGERVLHEHRVLGLDTHVVVDKGVEVALFTGLVAGRIVPSWLGILALVSSLLITIFGLALMKTGMYSPESTLFDRADRIICILIVSILVNYQVALILVCGINGVILIQRLCSPATASMKKSLIG